MHRCSQVLVLISLYHLITVTKNLIRNSTHDTFIKHESYEPYLSNYWEVVLKNLLALKGDMLISTENIYDSISTRSMIFVGINNFTSQKKLFSLTISQLSAVLHAYYFIITSNSCADLTA
jgi:hypothetical protein